MSSKLAILVWSADATQPELCAAPFVYAAAACALDAEVEVHFAARAVRLLVRGVADAIYPTARKERSIHEFLQDAARAGARFLACSMALKAHVAPGEVMVAEFGGAAGAASFVARALDPEWRTLVF